MDPNVYTFSPSGKAAHIMCFTCKRTHPEAMFLGRITGGKQTIFKMCENCRMKNREAKRRMEENGTSSNKRRKLNTDEIKAAREEIKLLQVEVSTLQENVDRLESKMNDFHRQLLHRLENIENTANQQRHHMRVIHADSQRLSYRIDNMENSRVNAVFSVLQDDGF